jgi:3-hydroxy-9,10-secoandrosta-1,3,5(10)-triene-9,17-dione monooxygenase
MSRQAERHQGGGFAAPEGALVGTQAGYKTFVDRAWQLVPLLEEKASEAEELGHTPDCVVSAILDAGLFRILRPARYGGYAQPADLLFEIGSILARGCMSTAWVFVNLAIHDLYAANWPVCTQEEIWGGNPDALIGSSFVFPAGRAVRVSGGYQLSGRWPFSSGIHPCQWNILGAVVVGEHGEPPRQRYFMLKRAQYEILDTWHVEALRGTGSADVEAKDVFVPDHMTVDYVDLLAGRAEGAEVHDDPTVAYPFAASGGFVLLCAIYGAARGAYEQFIERAKGAVARSSGKALAAEPTYQSKLSEVGTLLDIVEQIIRSTFRSIDQDLRAGRDFTGKEALRIRRDSAYVVRMCVDAIDILFKLGGGAALYKRNALQRAWRDIHGGAAHIVFQWDIHGVAYGRVNLGLPSGLPGMSV